MESPGAGAPCFYWRACRQQAVMEKAGRSVCASCAQLLTGLEYPLRPPSRAPLYKTASACAWALEMIEPRQGHTLLFRGP